ncbi:MAG: histidinol dehydrogenase [Ruminococcaceae bacterium]|nr:histidinol dehydrogenase [Oscillospiraceae bacterium]
MINIIDIEKVSSEEIFARTEAVSDVSATVTDIIADVRKRGNAALFEYAEKFDRAKLERLEVTAEEIEEAMNSVSPRLIEIMENAAENIRKFHSRQVRNSFVINDKKGVVTGQKVLPLDSVGLYVPGGTAAYPSSVLMNCIPAKIAGVERIVIATPATGGRVNPVILAAASVAGADKIYKMGGAQAVAALAYGTETIACVDKIVGPGNAYVAEAKRQVFGKVAIDMIAGPSEILIVADGGASAKNVAADLLSQAEHDKLASAVLITSSKELAEAVSKELEVQIPMLERADIARASIDNNGKIIICQTIEKAIEISNEIAPEHLELCIDNPFDYLDSVKHAGSVFMGRYCPEALGDYFSGANHTLPTSGTARFSSPLSVDDFVKKMQYTYYSEDAFKDVYKDVADFATAEGLTAHAKSALTRFED